VSVLEVRIFGDPVLRQAAREVTEFDDRLAKLADDMMETMRANAGVGLAANQVGVLKRLFTWEIDWGELDGAPEIVGGAVVNPVLLDASDEAVEDEEGCLSFPGLFYPVQRPMHVQIGYRDLAGGEQRIDLDDFEARVFLHEMDHLDGILFIDHLAKHDRKEALRRMREYRETTGLEPDAAPRLLGGLLGGEPL